MAQFLAQPYEPSTQKEATILGAVAEHPWWFTAPSTYEQRLVSTALVINDPFNRTWEVWDGGQFVGILILQRISWGADALMHFVFFDRNLVNKRQLLLAWMDHCFQDLGFQRLSFEVPEYAAALLNFARRKLGFRYEGEDRLHRCLTESGQKIRLQSQYRRNHREPVAVVLASQASRRERSHWYEDGWTDVLCLRTTREEFTSFVESQCPSPSLPPLPPPSPALPPTSS
jgi:RimJ/RimL family protein N-acetyltransferase